MLPRLLAAATALALLAVPLTAASSVSAEEADTTGDQEYVVLYDQAAPLDEAREAIAAAGGTIVDENTDVGVATVVTRNSDFTSEAQQQSSIVGTARNRFIGEVPEARDAAGEAEKTDGVETEGREAATAAASALSGLVPPAQSPADAPAAEPLASLQWDMQQIGATPAGTYRSQPGDADVLVGIMDTGVDGSHPDIAPNFDSALSRNFTRDIPFDANGEEIDGPCEEEPDQSCEDPADVDEDGHGTHVASTIASPINGVGIAGVAPGVTIVNLRVGQDSGYFFLQSSVDALVYAAKNGVDVVNMSYYIDPWLFNCASNAADSPEDRQEQATVVAAMQRALDYAHLYGVTLVAAAGNGATDYTKPLADASSPDFADVPGEVAHPRDLLDPADCVSMPSEGNHVISVGSTGPSGRKAYYSDYGNGYVDLAAPGGDAYDTPTGDRATEGLVLAAYPESLAVANGQVDADGEPTVPYVLKSCDEAGTTCGYYQYLQGTSMASPHAAGVAALVVSEYGLPDWVHGGRGLFPSLVEWRMKATAAKSGCPAPAEFVYTRNVPQADGSTLPTTSSALCESTADRNGFFGKGRIDALRATGN